MGSRGEKRPKIIRAGQLNDTFGSSKVSCSFKKALFPSQKMAFQLGECRATQTGNLDRVASQAQERCQGQLNSVSGLKSITHTHHTPPFHYGIPSIDVKYLINQRQWPVTLDDGGWVQRSTVWSWGGLKVGAGVAEKVTEEKFRGLGPNVYFKIFNNLYEYSRTKTYTEPDFFI